MDSFDVSFHLSSRLWFPVCSEAEKDIYPCRVDMEHSLNEYEGGLQKPMLYIGCLNSAILMRAEELGKRT